MFLSSNTPNVRIECKGRLLDAVFDTGNVKSDFEINLCKCSPKHCQDWWNMRVAEENPTMRICLSVESDKNILRM